MTKKQIFSAPPLEHSIAGLRLALFEELESVRSRPADTQRSNDVVMLANTILQFTYADFATKTKSKRAAK